MGYRVDRCTGHAVLEVQVGPGCVSGCTYPRDEFTARNRRSNLDREAAEVGVDRRDLVAVINDHHLAVTILLISEDHLARRRGPHRLADHTAEVSTGVEAQFLEDRVQPHAEGRFDFDQFLERRSHDGKIDDRDLPRLRHA